MAFVKAVIGAVVAGLLFGAGIGIFEVLTGAVARMPPDDKAVVYATSISVAVNCAAFFILVLVPVAVLLVFVVRRRHRKSSGRTSSTGQRD